MYFDGTDDGECSKGDLAGDGYVNMYGRHFRMLGESSNFIEAASTCTSEGAKLVSFTSEEEIWAFQMLTGCSEHNTGRQNIK